jgi:hypothetical protein
LSCQGASAIPNLFATLTPTATVTPTPTSTPTATPTLTPTPLAGINAEMQSDGTILVTDYDNKFQLSLPADWIVVPLKGEDITEILLELSKDNPDLKDIGEAFQNLDPEFIRLIALHKDPKYMVDGYVTNLTIAVLEDKVMTSMPMDFVTSMLAESLKQGGAKIVSSETADNANGVMVGFIHIQQAAPTAMGKKVEVYSYIMLFMSNERLVMVPFATPKQFGEEILLLMDGILDSIRPYSP